MVDFCRLVRVSCWYAGCEEGEGKGECEGDGEEYDGGHRGLEIGMVF